MGYWIEQTDCRVRMRAADKAAALEAMYRMWDPGRELDMTGGRWHGQERTFAWYAWTDHARWRSRGFATFEDAISDWDFFVLVDDDGDIVDLCSRDTKLGQQELVLAAIAPWVEAGSHLDFEGEDGYRWRWEFDGGSVREVELTRF